MCTICLLLLALPLLLAPLPIPLSCARLDWRQIALIVHSGLRGSVALVLALIIDDVPEVGSQ